MFAAITAWIFTAAICWFFMRRAVFNFCDPLLFVNIAIPFSAALLAFMCVDDYISWDKMVLFFVVLLAFLAGARISASFFTREQFRRAIESAVGRFTKTEITTILVITTCLTLLLAIYALDANAQGDARQDFNRAFRPIVTLHGGLWLFSLLLLLSPRLSIRQVVFWLVLLIVPSVAFSGKAVLLPVLFWFGLRLFIRKRRVNMVTIAVLTGFVLMGVGIMGLIAYGASSSAAVLLLIATRLWLSGDVYIYAYQKDALSMVRADYHVSFLAYMFHPITSLFGVRGYDKPLGSMLASEVLRDNVLVGPNPHLPVLLDYFFPDQLVPTILVSVVVGAAVLAIRSAGIGLAKSRSRYLALGGVAAAVFCPPGGFTDTSQVLISLVGIAAVTACGSIMDLLTSRGNRRTSSALGPAI